MPACFRDALGAGTLDTARPLSGQIDPQWRVARQHIEVAIAMKHGRAGANGNRTDETVDQPADGLALAPTAAIEYGRLLIVHRFRRKYDCSRKKTSQAPQMLLVSCAGKYFHADRVTDRGLDLEQGVDTLTDRRPGVAEKLDPRRCVDQDHVARSERISSRSPSQPAPRICRASSTLS